MEQLIVITVFAFCAAVCTVIFVNAFTTANDANDLNHALVVARSGAEVLRATDCLEETATILGGHVYNTEKIVVYYDSSWHPTIESYAAFFLSLTEVIGSPNLHELSIYTISGEEIISFNVSTGRRPSV
jgi:lantibiotic modifying enzyme